MRSTSATKPTVSWTRLDEKACKACLQLDSAYVSAYVILGMIAMRKNEDDKARHLLTKAVALEPKAIEPKLGFVLLSAGIGIAIALISAIIPFRKTARLDPIQVIQGG